MTRAFFFATEEFRASQRVSLRSHVFSPVTSPRHGRFDRRFFLRHSRPSPNTRVRVHART